MNILFIALILVAGVVVIRDAFLRIHEMTRRTHHGIRLSYVSLAVGSAALMMSTIPTFREFLMGGASLVVLGVSGLVIFNKRRLFQRDDEDRTIAVDDHSKTIVIGRSKNDRLAA